jgi:hypothetical protein
MIDLKTVSRLVLTLSCAAALALSGCAHKPTRGGQPDTGGASTQHEGSEKSKASGPGLGPVPRQCTGFCGKIQACAKKDGHEELGELLCAIARCETGDKCTGQINSSGARYRGAFQFSTRTWRSQCGPIFRAKKMKSCELKKSMYDLNCATVCSAEIISSGVNGGIRNWPACGRKVSSVSAPPELPGDP